MPPKNPLLLYLRSRLSVALAAAGAALIALALVFLPGRALLPVIGVILAWLVVTTAIFFSRRGAREIVQESEEDRLAVIRKKISGFQQMREHISVLRMPDERMSRAIEYFLQESGSYLEKCRELSTYSPFANERIERVLDICQAYLGERDEEATEHRYDEDASGTAKEDPAAGYARDILECARVIKERTVEDLLNGGESQRLAITKELEKET